MALLLPTATRPLNSTHPRPSLRAGGTLPSEVIGSTLRIALVGRSPRLDCFTLRVRNDAGPLSKQYPPKGVLCGVAIPVGCRLLNSTCPRPSLRASGTLPSEAIQWGGRLVWIASPCGFAMTDNFLNSTRFKVCCLVWLPPLLAAR
ncbi:MAG: hypothetical protein LBT00_14040 [Spirochaetaceae bacterium]|nr:hypothetical protein [Spirochaetaceae bacterium]